MLALSAVGLLVIPGWAGAASPGELDPTFGSGGVVTTDIGPFDRIGAIAVQPDGKIVAAGTASTTSWGLARYLPDGTLDPGFGLGGKVTTTAPAGAAFSLALGPAGTIVVAGFGDVVRYLATGAVDQSFGTGGRVSIPQSTIRAIIVLPDGTTLVAGSVFRPTGDDFLVARLTADGTLDAAFGTAGRVMTDLGGLDLAAQLLLQPDGRLVAVGETVTGSANFALVRYLPDGSLDPTFGSGGKVITDIGGPTVWDHGDDAVLTPAGRIVVTGASFPSMALARYLPDGTLDPTFGAGGIALHGAGEAWGVAQQADGKLVVTTGSLAAARFTADGALDGTFGAAGIADAGLPGIGRAVALDTAGHVIVAGSNQGDFVLARYVGVVAPDTVAPVLTVPGPMVTNADGPLGAVVSFTATATDDGDPDPDVVCTPSSGSLFAIGTTIVSCTATDQSGNSANATFPVHVKGAAEQLGDLAERVEGVGPGASHGAKVREAESAVGASDSDAACAILRAFLNQVEAQAGKSIALGAADALTHDANRISEVLGCRTGGAGD